MFLPQKPSAFTTARWVFARAIGAIFFCAFVSLGVQIRGLAGTRGIVSASQFLDAVWNHDGVKALWELPTVCWLNASDPMLVGLCVAGAVISLVMLGGFFPGLCSLVLWGLYLSLCLVSSPFTSFQWDALLLETALLAAILLPWQRQPRWNRWTPAQQAGFWLLWWLLFRLMFESGIVKLASGDTAWRTFSALDYHFETQCLPIWTAWYANQTPEWLLGMATLIMFLIELVGPLLILAPRRWRHGGAWALIALQVLIMVTGNYAFFNYLTIALCLLLFDDDAWPLNWPRQSNATSIAEPWTRWARWLVGTGAGIVFIITVQPLLWSLGLVRRSTAPVDVDLHVSVGQTYLDFHSVLALPSTLREGTEQFMSFNGYGLFAVMTTSRHEIEIEGSDDGLNWREYEFRWKPGDLNERPHLVAPHQPRLDWQMWFAALSDVQDQPWFVHFLVRLLEGSPEVTGLLRTNPFPDHPPHYIRAVVYDYHFTRFGDGQPGWWKRELLGLYCPPLILQNGQPTAVRIPQK